MSKLPPSVVYCFVGPPACVEPKVRHLVDQWLTPDARALNLHTYSVGDTPFTAVGDTLRLMPMLSALRVIILRRIDQLDDPDLQGLLAYLTATTATSRLILVGDAPPSKPLLTALKCAQMMPYEELSLDTPVARRRLMREFFTAHGQQLTAEAEQLVDETMRVSHTMAVRESLEQLSVYAGEQRTIERDTVRTLLQPVTESTVFQLAEAIGCGTVDTALTLLAEHARQRHHIPEVCGLLGWHFRRLWGARVQFDLGVSPATIVRTLRLPRRAEAPFVQQLQRWTQPALQTAARHLLAMDQRLKQGGADDPRLWLELTVITLTTVPDAGTTATSSVPPYSGGPHLY